MEYNLLKVPHDDDDVDDDGDDDGGGDDDAGADDDDDDDIYICILCMYMYVRKYVHVQHVNKYMYM
jgi:hypothetical protein